MSYNKLSKSRGSLTPQAQGSNPELCFSEPDVNPTRAVRVRLADWGELSRLCQTASHGPVYVTVTDVELYLGEELEIVLDLPDQIRVTIGGIADSVRPGPRPRFVIELTQLSPDLITRLAALAAPGELHEESTAQPVSSLKVSELMRRNHRLRDQIDQLARLRPRRDTEH